jgi:hypothetical protein
LPSGLVLADSYHCSRLNTNTGKLNVTMFESVFAALTRRLDSPNHNSRGELLRGGPGPPLARE